ncbi:MAG TPA: hypothetical protein VFT74_16160 [Isosphaeraceae bacterium]|nr:hypothetical protein [Isosphaeraceae bacterium]
MTPQRHSRMCRDGLRLVLVALMLGGGLSGLSGCDPRQALFFLQPFEPEVPAPCPSLEGKRVVILTSSVPGLATDYLSLDRDVARELSKALRANVKKIDVVDPSEVFDWQQAKPSWTDPTEAARAFEADVVILLEIRDFQIQSPSSPGLFQGHAETHIQVTELAHPKNDRGKPIKDQPKEEETIYTADQVSQFPVTGHIPVEAGTNAATFRGTFFKLMAKELSWHFISHAPGDDIQDTHIGQ